MGDLVVLLHLYSHSVTRMFIFMSLALESGQVNFNQWVFQKNHNWNVCIYMYHINIWIDKYVYKTYLIATLKAMIILMDKNEILLPLLPSSFHWITQQSNLAPALPVFELSSSPPLPRSSTFSWTTIDLWKMKFFSKCYR